MAVRQNIRGLETDSKQLAKYRSAFNNFVRRHDDPDPRVLRHDDLSYTWFASIHGLPLPEWCEHSRDHLGETALLFLPWHRAYLYYYELAMQGRLGPRLSIVKPPAEDDPGLPWWDWTSDESHQHGIPESYAQQSIGGKPNPLASARIPSPDSTISFGVWSEPLLRDVRSRSPSTVSPQNPPYTVRNPGNNDDLPKWSGSTDDPIESILSATTFEDFSLRLENGPHSAVHLWVGGSMSVVATAAFDPIFWSHHSMIDRLWYLWQNSGHGQNPPDHMLDTVLSPFPMTVAQTLDIGRLGYEYAIQVIQ